MTDLVYANMDLLNNSLFVFIIILNRPFSYFLAVGDKSSTNTFTEVEHFNELYQALQEIGDWKGLCHNLNVDDATMNALEYDPKHTEWNKRDCLRAYFDTGEATWEDVVRAVGEYPINNKRVAKKIANKYIHKKDEL